jgi:hypothetical protein
MQRFFPDFDSLNRFTLSLRALGDQVQCPHCSKTRQLISHGRVYRHDRQGPSVRSVVVGKRVFCSNRYQHTGCGRTLQIYVVQVIPRLRYGTSEVFRFVSALLSECDVNEAYSAATGQSDPRQGWRWLKRLALNLGAFRCWLAKAGAEPVAWQLRGSRRVRLLLSTLAALFALLPTCPCAHLQWQQQAAFM